jgi:hypothetical protein
MATDQEREYHTQRAQAELDWAYRAESHHAAEAHMRLSAMHMERMLQLRDSNAEL